MQLAEIRKANKDFFSPQNNRFFGTTRVTIKKNIITLHNRQGRKDYRYVTPDLALHVILQDNAGNYYFTTYEPGHKPPYNKIYVSIAKGVIIEMVCDAGHTANDVRWLPSSGGSNVIVCYTHYMEEKTARSGKGNHNTPDWDKLKRHTLE